MTIYHMATEADLDELAQMRWDFRLEEAPGATRHDQATFLDACTLADPDGNYFQLMTPMG